MSGAALELKALLRRAPRLTLAVAESLTAGLVQARVASVSGSSDYFLGGITAYSLDEKVRHLAPGFRPLHLSSSPTGQWSLPITSGLIHACFSAGRSFSEATK